MKGYAGVARNSVMANLVYRSHFFFTMIGNLLVILLTYFLWKAIYAGATTLKGLSFNDAFVSIALSTTIFTMFLTYVDWDMCYSVINGTIVQVLIKPVDYQLYQLSGKIGDLALNFVIIVIPSFLVLILAFQVSIPIGPNLIFFVIAVFLSFLMSFSMEFIIGLVSFYTNSIWGISATKNVIIMVLSGAVVPLAFFPDTLRRVAEFLPFRTMYDIPMRMLLEKGNGPLFYLQGYGLQIFWILVVGLASRLFYRKAVKVVTVNGG
jgi:ABC-2 type transport system permease protein